MTSEASGGNGGVDAASERYIPVRKADVLRALIDHGSIAGERERQKFRQLCHVLGAIYHHQFFAQLERLRDDYYYFNPEIEAAHVDPATLESFHAELVDTLKAVLEEANFVPIAHADVQHAHTEHHLLRVTVDIPTEDYREVLFFRRGHHEETVEISDWFGLRRRKATVMVYDRVAVLAMIKPDSELSEKQRRRLARSNLRPGSILIKYFRNIARPDLDMLFPQVRVVMSLFDKLKLGVPAIAGGIPILLNLLPTMTVLFVVTGFYLGFSGTIEEDDEKKALAALSGLAALGGFMLQQWIRYQRQSLKYHKAISDNVYFRNLNNNAGIFDYLIGTAEERDVKEAFLAYYFLHTAAPPLDKAGLEAIIEDWLRKTFAVDVEFDVDDAIIKLDGLGLLRRADGRFTVAPPDEALARLHRTWDEFFPSPGQ